MREMTTCERMMRMLARREADRVPITDSLWGATLARWRREGLPERVDWAEYFGLDLFVGIGVDNSPRYPVRVIEETDEYIIATTVWGTTEKNWKKRGGVPEYLDYTVKDRPSWQQTKARMQPTPDRVNWHRLEQNYGRWRQRGAWITGHFWFGFDVTHSRAVGTERVLEAMIDDPDWLVDMFNHWLDVDIALFDMVWEAGYHFDAIAWPDDMGYKGHQFFSPDTYRALLKPVHKRAADWAHSRGLAVELHSCGNVLPFIPDFIDIGVNVLNPLEVKAGMDPVALKKQYGQQLAFRGGINAALFWEPEKLYGQMRQVIPAMKQGGGYIISSDHSVPDSVSLEDFRRFVELAKQLGTY